MNIVRFKIELGVEEKFKCKNATKQMEHSDMPVQQIAMAKQSFCCGKHTSAYGHIHRVPSCAESHSARLILNGDNMLGLCDPSNLLVVYPPRSDTLFSNYF